MKNDPVHSLANSRSWKLKTRTLEFNRVPALMGILNVTPDSFSDGGKFYSPNLAVDQALRMEDAGANIIDIGGESTRPYREPVTVDEEIARVEPVLSLLAERLSIPVSIDTTKHQVAKMAIELGAEILNDVSGLEADPEMLPLAAESQVGVCAMHMRGNPQTMQDDPPYTDVIAEILAYLRLRDDALLAGGIQAERICLDPGIGFGKTHEHNLQLLSRCEAFHELGRPILVGHSRKGFVGKLTGQKNGNRDAGTLGISIGLALKGIQVLRVHDVEATRHALRCFDAMGML